MTVLQPSEKSSVVAGQVRVDADVRGGVLNGHDGVETGCSGAPGITVGDVAARAVCRNVSDDAAIDGELHLAPRLEYG